MYAGEAPALGDETLPEEVDVDGSMSSIVGNEYRINALLDVSSLLPQHH